MRREVVKAALVAVAAVAVFAVVWVLWPRPSTDADPAAPTRQYLNASACLLTGAGGVARGTAGGRAWGAMESASRASSVMVSYLPSSKPAEVPSLLNTLVEQKCGVIVVTGGSQAQVASAAKANPGRRFVFVTPSAAAGPAAVPPNAAVVSAASAPGRISQEVTALAGTA